MKLSGMIVPNRWLFIHCADLAERSGLQIDLQIADDLERFSSDLELVLFRCVQECLTNVHRHSGSKSAVIWIRREQDMIDAEVEDHGKGMPTERLAEIQSRGTGVGIRGMRERVRRFQRWFHYRIHRSVRLHRRFALAESV